MNYSNDIGRIVRRLDCVRYSNCFDSHRSEIKYNEVINALILLESIKIASITVYIGRTAEMSEQIPCGIYFKSLTL